ncbi:hypothetical protein BX600DRAFT_464585 [Xylariales sp. PMI_506]|nr:hypothetical protein BX600DRAFT_464585 [Xylariales sp. PMI_506]
MTGLRDLHWNVGYQSTIGLPPPILELLPPRVRLHTAVFCQDPSHASHVRAREYLAQLVGSQNLCSLSVRVNFIIERECLRTMRAVREVLLTCPNLVRLPLIDVWFPRGRADDYSPTAGEPYCGLGLVGGERPPPLEELGVGLYPWGFEKRSPADVYYVDYPEKGAEWDYWAETFDWSRLTRLHDVNDELAIAIASRLTSLREVLFGENSGSSLDRTQFLSQVVSPIELLTLPSWESVGKKPGPITRHGAELRRLSIHREEFCWGPGNLVSALDLTQLCNGLPRLEELSIDIARDANTNGWPYALLDAIAKLPCLRNLELWFKLGSGMEPAPTPFVTVHAASHLFGYLRDQGNTLQRLVLHSGAPLNSLQDGNPSWQMQNSITLLCDMVYHGDAAEGAPRVTCPDLSRVFNARLEALASGNGDPIPLEELDAKSLPLHLALNGPLSQQEWEAWRHLLRTREQMATTTTKTALMIKNLVPNPLRGLRN